MPVLIRKMQMKKMKQQTRETGDDGLPWLAGVNWRDMTPEEMSVMTAPSEDWLAAAWAAACLEREGCYDRAQAYWQVAAVRAVVSLDRNWCEARALWCARQEMFAGQDDEGGGR
ncbi:ANR family transcriptional regulator [Klebsiella aerogenes]|uniref:ANR family transcriptional regulator n=1 Tax=Klebsiella aerogenes TaxID=548 RepID=UPI002FFC778E